MTKLKSPRVSMRMGRLRSFRSGLMKLLMTPKMSAVTTMVSGCGSFHESPGTTWTTTARAIALAARRSSCFMSASYNLP